MNSQMVVGNAVNAQITISKEGRSASDAKNLSTTMKILMEDQSIWMLKVKRNLISLRNSSRDENKLKLIKEKKMKE